MTKSPANASRRHWLLTLACATVLSLLSTGAAGADGESETTASLLAPLPAAEWTPAAAAHLLRRAGFGGTPAEIAALHARGLSGAVAHLVRYARSPAPEAVAFEVTISERPPRSEFQGKSDAERRVIRNRYRRADRQQFQRLREWWLRRMIETANPLEERMTLFWHGHFTSSFRTVRNSYHMHGQNELLRREATGNFGTLLHDITRDPAMLRYLDGNRNRKGKPNENYAREVMELFTMGVGHYTEADIQAGARAFTGWASRGNVVLNVPRQHDDGEKTFLGHTGRFDTDDVLDIILAQKATPRHVARKVFEYFAYENPEEEIVAGLAGVLKTLHYDLRPMLEIMFRSRAFYAPANRGAQVKSPVVMIVSLFRTLGIDATRQARLAGAAEQLGQALFAPPSVKGWDGGADWITTSHLLNRYNLASAVVGTAKEQRALLRQEMERQATRRKALRAKREAEAKPDGETMDGPREEDAPDMTDGETEQAEDEAKARRKRRSQDGMRALRRLRRYRLTTPFDPVAYAKTHTLTTAAAFVDHLSTTMLAIPLEAEPRAELIAYLKASGEIDPTQRGAEARLRGALKLLVSTPEFQLN